MKRMWGQRCGGLVAAVVGGSLLHVGAAQSAQAQDFDVWFGTQDVRVDSGACRYVPFTINHDGGFLKSLSVDTEVWRGGQYVGSSYAYEFDTVAFLDDKYYWCPFEGLGQYRVGPAQVEWTAEGEPEWDPIFEEWETSEASGDFIDSSRGHFWIKQDQRAAVRAAKKVKGRVTVTVKVRFFDVENLRWTNDPKGTKVVLQRQTKSGWKKIGTGKVGKKGLVTVSGKAASGKHTYRVRQKGTGRTWAAQATFRR